MNTLRHTISLAGLCILLSCILGCAGTKSQKTTFVENPPFSISHAYSQNWVAGVRGFGSGKNLHITFSELPENVIIENFYYDNKKVKAFPFPKYRDQFTGYGNHYKGYLLNEKTDPSVVDPTAPFQLENEQVVIGYRFEGKKTEHFYKLPEVYEKPATEYPERNMEGIQ